VSREKYGRWMSAFREDEESSVEPTLDGLASGLASGTISRKRALKLAGAAVLGSTGLLGLSSRRSEAQVTFEGCSREDPFVNNQECPSATCGPTPCANLDCRCVLTRQGGVRCVDFSCEFCPTRDECDVNGDCPSGQRCVRVGGCCGNPRRNLCAPDCPSTCPSSPRCGDFDFPD
jgi:hypothetical protein